MRPSERLQYVIGALVVILFISLAFLPSSLLRWAGDHPGDDPGTLRFIGWFVLTGLCGAATGAIRQWADRRKNKWLLFLAVPPAAVLAYAVWFIFKRIVTGLARDPATLWTILFLIWVFLTWWLWEERRQYKKETESWKAALQQQQPSRCPHCGAQL